MIVFLDSNILGLICNTNRSFEEAEQCKNWFYTSYTRGIRFITSDICDYEVRRGLLISSQYQLVKNEFSGRRVVVATTNLKHLSLFCDAAHWQDIKL